MTPPRWICSTSRSSTRADTPAPYSSTRSCTPPARRWASVAERPLRYSSSTLRPANSPCEPPDRCMHLLGIAHEPAGEVNQVNHVIPDGCGRRLLRKACLAGLDQVALTGCLIGEQPFHLLVKGSIASVKAHHEKLAGTLGACCHRASPSHIQGHRLFQVDGDSRFQQSASQFRM